AAALAEAAGKSVTAENLPLTSVRFSGDLASMHFAALDKHWTCELTNFTLHDDGNQEDQRTTVNVLDRPRPSKPEGEKSKIRFINRTTGKIKLVHVDQAGERSEEGTIDSDAQREQATAAGQVWIVTDENDRPLGFFEAVEKPGIAVIEAAASRLAGFCRGGPRLPRRRGTSRRAPPSPH